jgi:hypothetical protein
MQALIGQMVTARFKHIYLSISNKAVQFIQAYISACTPHCLAQTIIEAI